MSRVKPWMKLLASGASAAVIATAIAGHFEGRVLPAYRDAGGVWTICDGHTRGVRPGDVATDAQCDAYRSSDMQAADAVVSRCYPPPPNKAIRAALDDLAFNEGAGKRGVKDGICVLKSGRVPTIRERAWAGDWRGVCDALLSWNKAAGKVLPGLVKRRAAERELCLAGLR